MTKTCKAHIFHFCGCGAVASSSVAYLRNLSSAAEQINNFQHLFKWSNHTPAVIVWSILKKQQIEINNLLLR